MPGRFVLTIPKLVKYKRNGTKKTYRMPPNANARLHWRVKYKIDTWFKDQMRLLCMEAKLPKGVNRVRITFVNYSCGNAEMDRDNLYSSVKPIVDSLTARDRGGVTGWGLVQDDKEQFIDLLCTNRMVKHRPEERAELEIEIIE